MADKTDYLGYFTSGQVAVDEKSAKCQQEILDNLTVTVVDQFHWGDKNLKELTGKLKNALDHGKPKKHNQSCEHLVFYCTLTIGESIFDVVVKFRLKTEIVNGLAVSYVKNMTKAHSDELIRNYNTLSKFLKDTPRNVSVIPVLIVSCKQGGFLGFRQHDVHLWVESELKNFRKFWCDLEKDQLFRLVYTDEEELRKLQKAMFEVSEETYTICDLQGEKKGDKFILTDIEYTNTLKKLGWEENNLLDGYREMTKKYEPSSSSCPLF